MDLCLYITFFAISDILAKYGEFKSMFRRSKFGGNRWWNCKRKTREKEISMEVFTLMMTCTVPELIDCRGPIITIVLSAIQNNIN